MRIVRTIMAVVLAVAVAAMPAAASALAAAGTTGNGATAQLVAMPADCAHHHVPADRGHKGADDGAATAACAVKCFSYVGTVVPGPGIAMTPIAAQPRPLVSARRTVSNIAAPPFRPPWGLTRP